MAGGLSRYALDKFQTKQTVTGTGPIGIDEYVVQGEHFLKVVLEAGAAGSTVRVEGRIQGQTTWDLIQSVVGVDSAAFDITVYDFIRFRCSVYGGSEFLLAASGFYVIPATLSELDSLLSAINQQYKASSQITNIVTPGTPGTEFSHTLRSDIKAFRMRIRGNAIIQIADNTGETNTKFWTIRGGTVYSEDNFKDIVSGTMYMECNKANEVVEIREWY